MRWDFFFCWSSCLQCIPKTVPSCCFITMVTRFKIAGRNLSGGPEGRLIAVNTKDRDWSQFENQTCFCGSKGFLVKKVCVELWNTVLGR